MQEACDIVPRALKVCVCTPSIVMHCCDWKQSFVVLGRGAYCERPEYLCLHGA